LYTKYFGGSNILKNIITHTSIVLVSTLLITTGLSSLTGVTTAKADSQVDSSRVEAPKGSLNDLINQTFPNASQSDEDGQDTVNMDALSPAQVEEMQQLIADHAIVKRNGNETDITIMDSSVIGAYESVTKGTAYSENRSYSGKTRFQCHGPLKNGNFDVYLSKLTVTAIHAGVAAGNLALIIFHAYGYHYIKAVKDMANAITNTVKAGNTKTGMHFRVRHWTSVKKL